MKKDAENKGKFGIGFLTKKEDQPEVTPQAEVKEELSDSEEGEEEEAPEALEGEGDLSAEEEAEQDESKAEAEKEAALTKEEVQGEDSQAEVKAEEEEEAPAWMEVVLEGSSAEDPDGICKVPDKELLKIKGIGKGTLKQIREIYPYQEPKRSGKVMIEVLPMRGIGGVGQAGAQAEMDWEQAEQYVRDGYVKILE